MEPWAPTRDEAAAQASSKETANHLIIISAMAAGWTSATPGSWPVPRLSRHYACKIKLHRQHPLRKKTSIRVHGSWFWPGPHGTSVPQVGVRKGINRVCEGRVWVARTASQPPCYLCSSMTESVLTEFMFCSFGFVAGAVLARLQRPRVRAGLTARSRSIDLPSHP